MRKKSKKAFGNLQVEMKEGGWGKFMRLCELQQKEVINICSGNRLGEVDDIIFEEKSGQIVSLIVPGPCKVMGMFGRDHEYVIPYRCIKQIGKDVILVEIDEEKCFRKCNWE